jgi:hypothetical protein
MAVKTVDHVAMTMGTAAFCHHPLHDIVIDHSGLRTERRLKHMTGEARTSSRGSEDEFPVRVLCGAGCDLRHRAPVLGMTGQACVLQSHDFLMEDRG